ncbi:MAG: peptide chain release factor N(5)-glutamine methyltransferase [Cyanobacteria bacterium SIG30]|nr:peptide chain release factor N(5)-glutamine methyltransferase [Cyanobacteria bacterium SIG30]
MQIFKQVEEILNSISDEPKAEARYIIEFVSGQKLSDIFVQNKVNNEEKIIEIAKIRAQSGKPIQQILGFAYFMGEKFMVDENVLIPRDETEILVRETVKIAQKMDNPQILDIGVGSGCISCMISKLLEEKPLQVLGVDNSIKALKIAIENVQRLVVANRVIIRKSDIFSNIKTKFDIIVSNPPYIKEGEILQKELKYEPQDALFAKNDGFYFYEKIIEDAPKFLNKGGFILFELGVNQADKVKAMLSKSFSEIETIKDLANIERVIKAKF